MSMKLERIAAEREKARKKRDEWDARLKEWELKYQEQENTEIHEMVHAANLTPEQLAAVLRSLKNSAPNQAVLREVMNEEGNEHED